MRRNQPSHWADGAPVPQPPSATVPRPPVDDVTACERPLRRACIERDKLKLRLDRACADKDLMLSQLRSQGRDSVDIHRSCNYRIEGLRAQLKAQQAKIERASSVLNVLRTFPGTYGPWWRQRL